MKVYTKTGDKGFTKDLEGNEVLKCDEKIVVQGDIDELNSIIGVIRSSTQNSYINNVLKDFQYKLYLVGICISTNNEGQFKESYVCELEDLIDKLYEEVPPQTSFIYYSGNIESTYTQYARAVCRRAERGLIAHKIANNIEELETVQKYINRLSDTLYIIGRYLNHISGIEDEKMML